MKLKKSKKHKKIKLNLFQKVHFKPKSVESKVLILLCAGVFGAAFFASGLIMGSPKEKIIQAFHSSNVLASGGQNIEDVAGDKGNISPEMKNISEGTPADVDSVKEPVSKAVMTKKPAVHRSANVVRMLSGPVPTGRTLGLPDGRRVCTTKSLHPQRVGKFHIDEDCCADYNEYPNPRCYYPPEKMEILKQR